MSQLWPSSDLLCPSPNQCTSRHLYDVQACRGFFEASADLTNFKWSRITRQGRRLGSEWCLGGRAQDICALGCASIMKARCTFFGCRYLAVQTTIFDFCQRLLCSSHPMCCNAKHGLNRGRVHQNSKRLALEHKQAGQTRLRAVHYTLPRSGAFLHALVIPMVDGHSFCRFPCEKLLRNFRYLCLAVWSTVHLRLAERLQVLIC